MDFWWRGVNIAFLFSAVAEDARYSTNV
ncbi:MAG: hypothetical protein ACJARI_002312, partial [Bacteroidia bacterium]